MCVCTWVSGSSDWQEVELLSCCFFCKLLFCHICWCSVHHSWAVNMMLCGTWCCQCHLVLVVVVSGKQGAVAGIESWPACSSSTPESATVFGREPELFASLATLRKLCKFLIVCGCIQVVCACLGCAVLA